MSKSTSHLYPFNTVEVGLGYKKHTYFMLKTLLLQPFGGQQGIQRDPGNAKEIYFFLQAEE